MQNSDDSVQFARTPGTPNSDTGLERELKTTVDDELFEAFLVKAHAAGGRARVLRDLVCMYVHGGLTYDEHVAKRRREQHFGTGRVIAHCQRKDAA